MQGPHTALTIKYTTIIQKQLLARSVSADSTKLEQIIKIFNCFIDCNDRSVMEIQVGKFDIKFYHNIKSYLDGNCDSKVDIQYGVLRLEAFLYALDMVNSQALLLHGHTLGAYIYDSCKNPNKGVICSVGDSETAIGIVGPETSSSIHIASMIYSSFTPQTAVLTYGDAGRMLQDTDQYPNLFQTVPSNAVIADALTDLAMLHNWTFVAVLYSFRNTESYSAFKSAADKKGICIKYSASTKKTLSDRFFNELLQPIKKQTTIHVVYLLLSDSESKALFRFISKHQAEFADLQFVGGQRLGTKLSLLSGNEAVALGLITFELESPFLSGFKDYFLSLRPENNTRNSFFKQFWEQVFTCSLGKSEQPCHGNETLSEGTGFFESVPVLPVIDAVLAISHALSIALESRCSGLTDLNKRACLSSSNVSEMYYNGTYMQDTVIANLPSVKFNFPEGRRFQFDSNKQQILNYTIYNTQMIGNQISFVKTGTWRYNSSFADPRFQYKDRLFINSSIIKWRTNTTPISSCGMECGATDIRVYNKNFPCCWTCQSCQPNSYVLNNTCQTCSQWTSSDVVAKKCVLMPIQAIDLSSALPIVIIVFATISIMTVCSILMLYIRHFKSRSIKSTSRELSLVSLFGLLLTVSTPLLFLASPSSFVCSVQQCLLGMSLTLCSVPLFLKTFVIYRIFRKAKVSTVAPKLSKKRSQVFICAGLITIQVLLCALWIQGNPGAVQKHISADRTHIITHCKYDVVSLTINFAYPCFIMVLATVFAMRTKGKNLPVIVYEGKRVTLASALTCLTIFLYLITFTVYFSDRNTFIQEYSISFVYIIIGTISLSFIFLPRICFVLRPSPAVFQSNFHSNIDNAEEQKTTAVCRTPIIDVKQSKEPQSIQAKCSRCSSTTEVMFRISTSAAD